MSKAKVAPPASRPIAERLEEQTNLAIAAGRRWATEKADLLRGSIPAVDWPESWRPEWAGTLPFRSQVAPHDMPAILAVAHHAAAERWAELMDDRRTEEAADEEEQDFEREAVRLFESVQESLPNGLRAVRDGERVYLLDEGGMERTITSLEQAFRVVGQWKEQRTL